MRLAPLMKIARFVLCFALSRSRSARACAALISAALAVCISAPLFAQEWIDFVSQDDRFTCNFPTQPKVTQITYRSQHEADLPARIYTATQGKSRYSVTVVDFNQAQRILTEKAKSCPAGAEPCLGGPGDEGHWKADIRGAIDYASWQLMQRDAKLTLFVWSVVDLVEGRQLQLTSNADKSRTFAGIYMHENRLYIVEGTVPPGYPEPGLFQQSLGWLDEKGGRIRYQSYYSNGFPTPPRAR
jgi:hypothetical protein